MQTINNPDQLAQLFDGKDAVLVKFGAPWCGPCKQIAPLLEQAAESHGDVAFAEVNIDDDASRLLTSKFGIRGVPTLVILKGSADNEIARKVGAIGASQLDAFIESATL